jgi:uncharacterized protein YjiK
MKIIHKMNFVAVIMIALMVVSCSTQEAKHVEKRLILDDEFALDILEPSGLAYCETDNTLWTVSDNTNQIYQIDMDGNILQTLAYVGQDLEGICYDYSTSTLWVVEESLNDLVNVSLQGVELQRYDIPIPTGDNSGLEAVCIGKDHTFYLMKEKNPGKFIELNDDFSIKNSLELDFADDYSGMCWDDENEVFWIVSDQSREAFLWTETTGVTENYSLNFEKAEGVALVPGTDYVYIVSDSEQTLYKYRIEEE